MTLNELLNFVNSVRPGHAFTDAQLITWVNEVEAKVQTDIMLIDPEELVQYSAAVDSDTGALVDGDRTLLVKAAWDKIYRYFLYMMIDLANGEIQRYSNSFQLFNEAYEEYAGWYATHIAPANGEAIVHGYYITAYQFAVSYGYKGSAEDFARELNGIHDAAQYAGEQAEAAEASATAASGSAALAAQWATGGSSGTPSATNNSKFYADQARAHYGAPLTASSAEDMTDTTRVYVYVGETTDTLTNGNWYYYDGEEWTEGGVYNSTAFETDDTLSYEGLAADAKATGDRIGFLEKYEQQKEYMFDGLPFYKIHAPLIEKRYSYNKVGGVWVQGATKRNTTAILPCPKYLAINPKSSATNLFVYIGDVVDGQFVVDETAEFYVTSGGVINIIGTTSGFMTYVSDGTKYMWLGVISTGAAKDGYEEYFDVIGCDEDWPESPFRLDSWSFYSDTGEGNRNVSSTSTDYAGYYLPEESWIFVKGVEKSIVNYGVGSTAAKPWANTRNNVSAFYIPKNSGMPMLTVKQSDVVNEHNVCVVPKILDRCLSSNAVKAADFAHNVLQNFEYIGKNASVNIAEGKPIVIGKKYHTIPYSGLWQPQHTVCYDTTPETAANAANDEYSVFYDDTAVRSELSGDEDKRPGYGGVCSTFASLANGSPYPQTTAGFYVDKNFETRMFTNPRSGDICQEHEDGNDHVALVDTVFGNGYSMYEYAPPGIIQSIHTSGQTVPLADYRVSRHYLDDYHHIIISRDRGGWKTNYLNFNYDIVGCSIRPWRGNKSVCSNYNKYAASTRLHRHTGISITVHDGATTAYIKKPGGDVVTVDVTGQTVVNIDSIVTEVGQYELWSDVEETSADADIHARREYFRYFDPDPVTVYIDSDGTVVFSSDDVDYAYVWFDNYYLSTEYPEVPNASPTVIAKGKKYPGFDYETVHQKELDEERTIFKVKAAVIRDKTIVNGVEDSWGRYPVTCSPTAPPPPPSQT